MNLLHITDLGNGNIQVSWQRGNAIARSYPRPIQFTDPLSINDRIELRWYLEDYLTFPYGAERWRAEQVENKMAEWGESLFKQVFVKRDEDPDPRGFYQEAVREGLERCELCITSENPEILNIPWELIRDPTPGRGYLAPSLAGLYRQRTGQRLEAPLELSETEPFRILLVISRPYGEKDIPLGTVARHILEALRPLRPRIELEVLRPPTFDALQERLNARRGFYNLVHFDGHGVFARTSSSRDYMLFFGAKGNMGHLVFEKEEGTPQIVNSHDLGNALATCKVPLFVLNACQSAEEGKEDPFSSVASQLVAIGAKGVVAMSYSVYASTASRFMSRFYETLVSHASLAEAVAAGRRRIHAEPERESIIGALELRDWMVPTLYQQEYRYVPIPEGAGVAVAEEDAGGIALRQRAEEVCPEGRFGFIGRDYDILRIERAMRDDRNPWVLLTGLGGTGKTELAFGFARWYAETGGCPGGVFAASFKEKADFGKVIGSIAGYGTDFSRLPAEEQWRRLVGYLRENSCLLIWDNFEPVAGYPQGSEPLADDEERGKLSRFLKSLRGGKSRALITTRKPDEEWLGIAYKLVELAGLTIQDATQLAKAILATVGRRPEDFKDDPEYAKLLKLLNGHPRSLEIVLPHLRRKSPREIIEALQHRVDMGETLEDASLSYAFAQMSSKTQKHLPFMGLFASYVSAGILGSFVGADDERQQTYTDVMGEALRAEGWEAVLEEAGRNGLLRPRGSRIYELHPTLPHFLRRQLVVLVGDDNLKRLDTEFMKFYAVLAAHFFEGVCGSDRNSIFAVTIEEANLLRALRLADMNGQWRTAGIIIQTLCEFYQARSRADEWIALRTTLLNRVGREISPDADRDQADLWMYLLGEEANHALSRNELEIARAEYQRILDYLVSLNDATVEPKIAVVYRQLGMIAQERNDFDQAEQWHRKALEIGERLGLERNAASDYHQLGIIAQHRNAFDQAEQWYRRALEISERLGFEGDAASGYHQLGNVASLRNDFAQAEQWYRKALEINEQLGLEREAALDYHQLGIIAQHRNAFDQAEQWYRKALEIFERLGHPLLMVNTLGQFGSLRLQQNRLHEAVSWCGRALAIATEYNMRVGGQILINLARVMNAMGEEEFTAAWRQAFEGQEPPLELIREVMGKSE